MKTPPLLLLGALLFWGWQLQSFWYGALAGVILEAARVFKPRWELEETDFYRVFNFCLLILLALGGYLFTTNTAGAVSEGPQHGASMLQNVTNSSSLTIWTVMRWLPIIFIPLLVAQIYNVRPTVPITAISMVMRRRQKRGEPFTESQYVDASYPYFMVCLFSAGIHTNQGSYTTAWNYFLAMYGYFAGATTLILWALWSLRSGRFGVWSWVGCLVVIAGLGFAGLRGVISVERTIQNLDAQLLAHFLRPRVDPTQSRTALGQIGRLKLSPRIVIRLYPRQVGVVPPYLREASYRRYDALGRAWSAGGKNDFGGINAQRDNLTWGLLPEKKTNAVVNIACYLNGMSPPPENLPRGALPLPSGTFRLENLPVYILETNETGVAMATGPGLVIFDARYGPGATLDSPPDTGTNQWDTTVPTNEIPALSQVIAEMNLTNASDTSDAGKRQAVESFFARNFTYSTWQGREKAGDATTTPLTRFLLTSRSGHCEYFATATVLLLRQLGIPARYAVGYSVHETSGSGYVVRERDAHAWCLVWNPQARHWEDFDTTPGSWVATEERNSPLSWLSDLGSWLYFQFQKLRWQQSNLQQYILWTFIPVLTVLLYYIIFQRRKRARMPKKAAEIFTIWPGHDSTFYRLEKALATRGLPRQPQESLSDWLERALAEPALAGLRAPLWELLELHYRYRFDPQGLDDAQKQSLVQNTETILTRLARVKSGR